jgi:hypothetical protein
LEKVVRTFKLALPLSFTVKDNQLIIKDRHNEDRIIALNGNLVLDESNPDAEGFVLFNATLTESKKPKQTILPQSQSQAHVNGFSLLDTKPSRAFGFGGQKSVFEYYKRDSDSTYYALIRNDGKKPRKVLLGSLHDQASRIFKVAYVINQNFPRIEGKMFGRAELIAFLPRALSGARILKSILDILVKEEFLIADSAVSGSRNRKKEVYAKTEKLEKFMADPRSWQKTNGLNTGSLAMTPNQ